MQDCGLTAWLTDLSLESPTAGTLPSSTGEIRAPLTVLSQPSPQVLPSVPLPVYKDSQVTAEPDEAAGGGAERASVAAGEGPPGYPGEQDSAVYSVLLELSMVN